VLRVERRGVQVRGARLPQEGVMTPKELQQANIDRFEKMLRTETDPCRRSDLKRVLRDEQSKDASAYPASLDLPK